MTPIKIVSEMSFEKLFKRNEPDYLSIITMGQATLYYANDIIVDAAKPTDALMSTPDLKYAARVPERERLEILRRGDDFKLEIVNNGNFVCIIECQADALHVPPNYHSDLKGVMQEFTLCGEIPRDADFSLRLYGNAQLRRIDLKYKRNAWISLFMFRDRVLTMRPNGNYFQRTVLDLCRHAAEIAREDKELLLDDLYFGLYVPSQTTRSGLRSPDMPSLVRMPSRRQRRPTATSEKTDSVSVVSESPNVVKDIARPVLTAKSGAVQKSPPSQPSGTNDNADKVGQSANNDAKEQAKAITETDQSTETNENVVTMVETNEKVDKPTDSANEAPETGNVETGRATQALNSETIAALQNHIDQFHASHVNIMKMCASLGVNVPRNDTQ